MCSWTFDQWWLHVASFFWTVKALYLSSSVIRIMHVGYYGYRPIGLQENKMTQFTIDYNTRFVYISYSLYLNCSKPDC